MVNISADQTMHKNNLLIEINIQIVGFYIKTDSVCFIKIQKEILALFISTRKSFNYLR